MRGAPLNGRTHQSPGNSPLRFNEDVLRSLVDSALTDVRVYKYVLPPQLHYGLDIDRRRVNNPRTRAIQRNMRWRHLEYRLYELLPPHVKTTDPDRATFFFVPHALDSHVCESVFSEGQMRKYASRGFVALFEHIVYALPYFNRSGGKDHLFVTVLEQGHLCQCHFRRVMGEHLAALAAYEAMAKVGYYANYDERMFGWRVGFDVAMPQYNASASNAEMARWPKARRWEGVVSVSKPSVGFSGRIWGYTINCTRYAHVCGCSVGIRGSIRNYLAGECNASTTHPAGCPRVGARMGSFVYALCPAGWACWSYRLFHAIEELTVPVVMANGIIQPFETFLDWDQFSVRIDTEPVIRGNYSELVKLNLDVNALNAACLACPACANCSNQPLVRRIQALERVRPWLRYANDAPYYNAVGLFMLELLCRQVGSSELGNGGRCDREAVRALRARVRAHRSLRSVRDIMDFGHDITGE